MIGILIDEIEINTNLNVRQEISSERLRIWSFHTMIWFDLFQNFAFKKNSKTKINLSQLKFHRLRCIGCRIGIVGGIYRNQINFWESDPVIIRLADEHLTSDRHTDVIKFLG